MTVNFPRNLIEEIAYRRCVIFIGSGISATAKSDDGRSPKTWGAFLDGVKPLIRPHTYPETIGFINKMLDQKNYLLALQAIYDNCDPGVYSAYLQDIFSRPDYKASNIHQLIKEMDAKVVITTNFDKIYDNICNSHGYTVAKYTETGKILSNLKSTTNLIIKAHGSIDDPDTLVFTQKQYFNAKKKHPQFYNLLQAIFMTNTVLFIGYSLNDPDINLILETISANSSAISCPHYVLTVQGVENELKKFWHDCYNISCLEYGPGYEQLEENIAELTDQVISYRADKKMP
ncbi:SIR2 family NAD-dependent protein deacylase [Paenibacillus alvei]|uniref:SIR2 family protein n=1 Tax=Paenibacillus alvei TaxID=44250 RepID=A0AAP6ZWD5_PAEAL|nr:SIR2 family protein [Paenibacillus alvei]NOJ69854.1 SIR2 family protein [Paenibacillus alvei]